MRNVIICICITICSCLSVSPTLAQLIQPSDLSYRGAFRLPEGSGDSDWTWSGDGMTYYPGGDPGGAGDGYPGSIFATGLDTEQYVSEISIPAPVISAAKNVEELPTAATLQTFHNIRGDLFGHLDFELPRAGLQYLPRQAGQDSDKLYFTWGQHQQQGATDPALGWCNLNLASPGSVGAWRIGDYLNQVTTDYLFEIPSSWASVHTPGKFLAAGRYQDGGQGGEGPAIFACGPWNDGNPPEGGSTIDAVPLLLYQNVEDENPRAMNDYHHSDEWSGGAWLTAGNRSAVIFVGTKGKGDCWYGNPAGPCHDCDNRGWWSTTFEGQIIFYNPADLAAVAAGRMAAYEPQPYATMNIDDVLFHITSSQQWYHVNAVSFDRERGHLYVFESLADVDDKSLVHVWSVEDGVSGRNSATGETGVGGLFRKLQEKWGL